MVDTEIFLESHLYNKKHTFIMGDFLYMIRDALHGKNCFEYYGDRAKWIYTKLLKKEYIDKYTGEFKTKFIPSYDVYILKKELRENGRSKS